MRAVTKVGPRTLAQAAALAAIAGLAAGCSSDTSRFNDNPFANRPSAEVTGSLPPQSAGAVGRVESAPLPGAPPAVASAAPMTRPAYQPAPPPPPPPHLTEARHAPRFAVAKAETHGAPGVHVVAPGETLSTIAHHYHVSVKDIVAVNRMNYDVRLKMGDRIVIPRATAAAEPAAAEPKHAAPPAVAAKPAPAPGQKVASLEPQPTARMATPAAQAHDEDEAASRSTGSASPTFRWPVKGRVISGFGNNAAGQSNDGVNLAVPEGTAVRAAEDGVVAYAGSELKGYGNLVLIRHSSGFVTAYAHASELMVKRGDQVRRGQVIAKSGQSGSVTSPQLHFEIRKGSTPVDPVQYLPSA